MVLELKVGHKYAPKALKMRTPSDPAISPLGIYLPKIAELSEPRHIYKATLFIF